MRWKLLLITSLLATLVGAGASLGIIFGYFDSPRRLATFDLLVIATLLIPFAATIAASIFVSVRKAESNAAMSACSLRRRAV